MRRRLQCIFLSSKWAPQKRSRSQSLWFCHFPTGRRTWDFVEGWLWIQWDSLFRPSIQDEEKSLTFSSIEEGNAMRLGMTVLLCLRIFPLTVFLLRSGLSLLVYWAPLSVHFENTYSISSSSFSLSFPLAFSRCIRGNSRAGREGSERPSNGASSDKRPLGYSVFWPVCFSPWMNPVQRSLHSEMRRFF